MAPNSEHSIFGASSAARWTQCHGSIRMIEAAPEQEESPYAEEGTIAHEYAEEYLLCGFPGVMRVLPTASPEMQDYLDLYIEEVYRILGVGNDKTLLVEEQFNLDHLSEGMWGTNDACVIDPFDTIHILDLKYGQGIVVQAEENLQLAYYALGAAQLDPNCHTVRMTIVQPRTANPIRTWEISIEELMEYGEFFKGHVEAIKGGDDELVAGDHCRFCPAIGQCPAQKALMEEINAFDPVLPEVALLSIEDMLRVLEVEGSVKKFIAAVAKRAEAMLKDGQEVPGYKLVKKTGNRTWKDEDEAIKALKKLGLKMKEMKTTPELLSPAQIEKLDKNSKDIVASLVMRPDNGLGLAAESDSRPAVEAKPMFEEVPEDE